MVQQARIFVKGVALPLARRLATDFDLMSERIRGGRVASTGARYKYSGGGWPPTVPRTFSPHRALYVPGKRSPRRAPVRGAYRTPPVPRGYLTPVIGGRPRSYRSDRLDDRLTGGTRPDTR